MINSKKIIWGVVVLIALVAIAFFSMKKSPEAPDTATKNEDTGPIKVGVILPLTGDGAVYGEPARNIYQMAVVEINAADGVGGRMLELVVEDSKCTGETAVSAAQKLINVDKVKVIIGGFCSSESLAATPVAANAKVVLFSPGSSSPDLTGASPFFFRNYPSDASQGTVLARIAYNDKKYKTVAFIQEQTDYAAGVYKAFNEEFTKLGGTVTNESFPTKNTDFRAIVTKIKDAKPDAVFIDTQTPAVGTRIMQQSEQLQYKPALIVNDVISGDPDTVTQNAEFLEGALTAEFGIDPQNQKFQHLITAYKEKYGQEPPYQSYAQTEYDAVFMVRDALLANGEDGEKIAKWSRTVKDWEGASGKITILPSGDRDGGHSPRVIKSGKVAPYTK
ncbi:ABC transporter substrate-binding protein [Candidatus Kaiserbacteria bacterium]|nr:ABC transporter substrate-binding protein [Candidatus Kaiserbacteria bacterium]